MRLSILFFGAALFAGCISGPQPSPEPGLGAQLQVADPTKGVCFEPRMNSGEFEFLHQDGGVFPPFYYVGPENYLQQLMVLKHAAEYELTKWNDQNTVNLDAGCHTVPKGIGVHAEVFVAITHDGREVVTRAEVVLNFVPGGDNKRHAWGVEGQYTLEQVSKVLDNALAGMLAGENSHH